MADYTGPSYLQCIQGAKAEAIRAAADGPTVADTCAEYLGTRDRKGYGVLWFDGRYWRAHRLAWTQVNGPIPAGMFVCHSCDNPACIEVTHLFLGSHDENMRDMSAKGRGRNSKKTHCPQGHAYDAENTYRDGIGRRYCRECHRIRAAMRRTRHEHV